MEENQTLMEEKQMQLDGKVSNVLLSSTNNVVVLADFKTMIMSFIGKTLNPTSITTPFDPKSTLEHQEALVAESPLVEPTLNIRVGTILCTSDGVRFITNFSADGGGEYIETKSKEKENIAKDGLGPSKQCQKTQGKKKGLVTITKVLADVVELWNELTNGSWSFNSLAKVDITLVVQKKGNIKNHQQKVLKLWDRPLHVL